MALKRLSPEFMAVLAAIKAGTRTAEFAERVDVTWPSGLVSYRPLDTSGTMETPLLDGNPYWFELADPNGVLRAFARGGGHRKAAVTVYISYDGGVTWADDWAGTVSRNYEIQDDDRVRFNAVGLLAGLDHTPLRMGTKTWHRRHVDANDGLYDEAGFSRRRTGRRLGAAVT